MKHGDSKLIKGVGRSYIDGSLLVYEGSQTFLSCTPDEIYSEVVCECEEELETWDIPYAKKHNPDHIERAVIVTLSYIYKLSLMIMLILICKY